jgi:phosphoribosylglycinamide formyltransferase-1
MLTDSPRPLRVAVLSSYRAPGVRYLLEHPEHGEVWEIVTGVVTHAESELSVLGRQAGVPVVLHDIRAFYRRRQAVLRDRAVRWAYDRQTASLLAPARPDVVLLTGYLYLVTEPLLAAYPDRIVNVHDSDLLLRGPDGRPRYRGLHSTRDAIAAGEPETRLTAHLVTSEVDEGPILARSPGFRVPPLPAGAPGDEAWRHLKRVAWVQRERMMQEAWGPLLVQVLAQLREQRLAPDRAGVGIPGR